MFSLHERNTFITVLLLVAAVSGICYGANDSLHSETVLGDVDLIIRNGRVIDPETGLDTLATVAIKDGIIQRIVAAPDTFPGDAPTVINAEGSVVSPGFINTHTHETAETETEANIKPASKLYVFDGITFWLGGNCGLSPTGIKVDVGDGNFMQVGDPDKPMTEFLNELENIPLYNHYATLSGNITLRSRMGLKHMQKENDEQIEKMKAILAEELAAGSFGLSIGAMYDMGATTKALIELAKVSREHGGMAAIHTRYPTFNLKHLLLGVNFVFPKRAIYEAINICQISKVPLIVSHITDMSQADSIAWAMETLDNAVREGLPLAGDIIGHDFLINNFFILTFKGKIPVPIMMKFGNYSIDQFYAAADYVIDGQVVARQFEQFTMEKANFLREHVRQLEGFGQGIRDMPMFCQIMPPEDTMLALRYPWVFIGNDGGGPSIDPETGEPAPISPRGLTAFSRLLGHWSREKGALSLHEAIFKASTAPAIWLGLEKKGRIQEGCDADIVIFDPETIIDRAGWVDGTMHRKPDGISHVIVSGEVVVENNELTGAAPGRLVRRTWRIPGNTADILALYDNNVANP